ncbi:hypothetical protein [Actinoplanes sp. NPDC048796]|uniref:hypothetical protein n=1 Tax=unclassified Actinoplanes TaxID=2626549 RepID=UPI0033DB761B
MILGIVVVAALLVGFLAGLVSFKKTNEYCERHGVTRLCPLCTEDHPRASAWCTERTALAPSPTAAATRFSEA